MIEICSNECTPTRPTIAIYQIITNGISTNIVVRHAAGQSI